VKRSRGLLGGVIQLAVAALLIGPFFIPIISLPFGQSISLFDLLSGALSGGAWRPARLLLLILFAALLALLGAGVRQVVRARHESVA
jgi:hypothetical protein